MIRIIGAMLLLCVGASAGEAVPSLDTLPTFDPMLVQKYPWIASILGVIAILRLTMKPVFSAIHNIVYATPTKKDDEWLAKCESSIAFKVLVFLLDYIGSIKLIHPGTQPAMSIPKSTPSTATQEPPKPTP